MSFACLANPEMAPPQAAPWIRFTIDPPEAVQAGAQWKFATETEWRDSGLYYTNVQPGTYQVEFKQLPGWVAPSLIRPVVVKPDSRISLPATYFEIRYRPDSGTAVMVFVSPPQAVEAGAAWRLAGETAWRDPRLYYADVPVGEWNLEFKPVPGWKTPANQGFSFQGGNHFSSHSYEPIQVPAQPSYFSVYASPGPAGAQWNFTSDTEWRDISVFYTNVSPGSYIVEFKPVEGWVTPTNRNVVIQAKSMASLHATYMPRPQHLVNLSATNGFIVGDTWHLRNLNRIMRVDEHDDYLWFYAQYTSRQGFQFFPYNDANRVAPLLAKAWAGYQFTGWSGDVQGVRNPVPILLDSDKNVTAHFALVSTTELTATQLAESYYSPGILTVHAQVNCPIDQQFESLSWRPALPGGWTLLSAQGFGRPQVEQGKVIFTQPLASCNPVQFNLFIEVPGNQSGTQVIGGEVQYALKEGTNLISATAQANSLQIVFQEKPAPQLSLDLSMGPALLTIQGVIGKTYLLYRLDGSTNNADWKAWAALTLTNSIQTRLDPLAGTNATAYLYRAALLE